MRPCMNCGVCEHCIELSIAHAEEMAAVPAPKAITCDAIRAMCETDGQRAAVMIAVSDRGTQFCTWGKSAEDKVYARDLSEHLSDYLGCGPRLATHESFVLDAAKVKERMEAYADALRAVLLFHDGGPWHELHPEWNLLTGGATATTKGLCDFIRETLSKGTTV